MKEEQLVKKLNWFYTLEITQVENYLTQSKALDNKYFRTGLERVAFIEENHVDNISKTIIALGHSPTLLGDVISPIIGLSIGKLISLTDIAQMMKLNIQVEAKAASDYFKLINLLKAAQGDKGIIHTLTHNMIDEDMHSSWFKHIHDYHQHLDGPLSPVLVKEV